MCFQLFAKQQINCPRNEKFCLNSMMILTATNKENQSLVLFKRRAKNHKFIIFLSVCIFLVKVFFCEDSLYKLIIFHVIRPRDQKEKESMIQSTHRIT